MLISLYTGQFYKPMQITKSEQFSLVVWGMLANCELGPKCFSVRQGVVTADFLSLCGGRKVYYKYMPRNC